MNEQQQEQIDKKLTEMAHVIIRDTRQEIRKLPHLQDKQKGFAEILTLAAAYYYSYLSMVDLDNEQDFELAKEQVINTLKKVMAQTTVRRTGNE